MEENKKQPEVIDLRLVIKKIWEKKRMFIKLWIIVFFLSSLYIVSFPRYYTSEVRLAPELGNNLEGGALGSLASSFGFNLGGIQTADAISPMLYPDLMEDNGFVTSLFNVHVKDIEGEIDTTYYAYLKSYQKKSWLMAPIYWINSLLPKTESYRKAASSYFDPYFLSKRDDEIAAKVRNNILLNFNEKTLNISIRTKAQDPLICKTLADSVTVKLQDFITKYRTNKARIDYEYYQKLVASAKHDYERVRQQYGATADADIDVSMKSIELKIADLENDMQLKYNTYSTMCAQMESAKAKVQERTPAFTVVKGADVPVKPAGPKRMLFVLFMLILSTMIASAVIVRDDLFKIIAIRSKNS